MHGCPPPTAHPLPDSVVRYPPPPGLSKPTFTPSHSTHSWPLSVSVDCIPPPSGRNSPVTLCFAPRLILVPVRNDERPMARCRDGSIYARATGHASMTSHRGAPGNPAERSIAVVDKPGDGAAITAGCNCFLWFGSWIRGQNTASSCLRRRHRLPKRSRDKGASWVYDEETEPCIRTIHPLQWGKGGVRGTASPSAPRFLSPASHEAQRPCFNHQVATRLLVGL